MTKTLIVAAAVLLGATSASLAQGYGYGAPYGSEANGYAPAPAYGFSSSAPQYGNGLYDFAPGYGSNVRVERGGPGPRVGNGVGEGIGGQR